MKKLEKIEARASCGTVGGGAVKCTPLLMHGAQAKKNLIAKTLDSTRGAFPLLCS
jgi:hypothetical protein